MTFPLRTEKRDRLQSGKGRVISIRFEGPVIQVTFSFLFQVEPLLRALPPICKQFGMKKFAKIHFCKLWLHVAQSRRSSCTFCNKF